MCFDELGLSFLAAARIVNCRADLCNRDLTLNREFVCLALNACIKEKKKILTCFDGNSACGLMGMLWKKYLGENVHVDINGVFPHSLKVIKANADVNDVGVMVIKQDPCIWLRLCAYDFIFLNCKTSASMYFDSVFANAKDDAVVAFTTSDDPSLHWQSPGGALRRYGGTIMRTSYFRELGIRLVLAEMVRVAARYRKTIKVLCCMSFKSQQSFTIIIKVKKDFPAAVANLKEIKRVLHCSTCEDRAYAPNTGYLIESLGVLLSCNCRKRSLIKTTHVLGPVWSGDIFCTEFIGEMLKYAEDFPWAKRSNLVLGRILEEARCDIMVKEEPDEKKPRLQRSGSVCLDVDIFATFPSFYYNTHKHRPKSYTQLLKVSTVVDILRRAGYRASRTHFEPEAVRTNATLREFMQALANK